MPTTQLIWLNAGFAATLLLTARLTRQLFRAFKRRKKGYGTVFDSATGKPVQLAMLSLRDLHGQIVRTAVADNIGRYRLLAPRGEYYLNVGKPGYTFPSKRVTKDKNRSVYENILPSPHIQIQDYGVMTKNIPLDPANGAAPAWWKGWSLGKHAQQALSLTISLAALAFAYWMRDIFTWSIFVLYAFFMLRRLFSLKPPEPPFGTVMDAETKKPLADVVVRILETRFNKLLETQVTLSKGRYAFIVNRGSFMIMAKKPGYRTVVLKFPKIKSDGFLLAKNIKLKKGKSAES